MKHVRPSPRHHWSPPKSLELDVALPSSSDFVASRLSALRVRRADIDDLRQDVFMVALKKQPHLYDEAAANAYLAKVCEFVALAHHRRAYRRYEVPGDLSETAGVGALITPQAEEASSDWAADRLHAALSLLTARQREILALRLAADMSFRSLAELHDCDVKTMRKRYQLALRQLQRHLAAGVPVPFEGVANSNGRLELTPPSGITLLGPADGSLALGVKDRTLIVSFRGAFTDAALERFLAFGEELVKERGAGLSCLSVVEPFWPSPRYEERQRLNEAMQFLDAFCGAFSLVGVDQNQRLAEQIVRAHGFLQQTSYSFGSFDSVHAGARWVVSQDRPRPEMLSERTAELVRAVEQTREQEAPSRAPASSSTELVHHGVQSSLALSSLGDTLVSSWLGPVTQTAVAFLVTTADRLRAERGRPLAHLSIVEPESPRPRFAERQRLLEIARMSKRNLAALGFVARSSNQRLAEQIIVGMGFLVRSTLKLSFAPTEAGAAKWLVEQGFGVGPSAELSVERLLDALATTRSLRDVPNR